MPAYDLISFEGHVSKRAIFLTKIAPLEWHMMSNDTSNVNLVSLAADIVSAYVARNSVPVGELPALIASTHAALTKLGGPVEPAKEERPTPPVPIKKTITPDYIISLEDGRQYRTLKRHLAGRGLTPEQYRAKWGLPVDYPMVAANYAAERSEIAKSIGLGRKAA